MTARKQRRGPEIANSYIEDQGKRYRICRLGSRVIMVGMRRSATGLEQALDPQGRRARQIIRIEQEQGQ